MKPRFFVLLFITAVLFVLGTLAPACGDNGDDEDTIRDKVEELVEVLNDRDFDRLAEIVTADFLDVEPTAEALEEALKALTTFPNPPYPQIRGLQILSVEVDGDEALVVAERSGGITANIRLVKQGDRWLVNALPGG